MQATMETIGKRLEWVRGLVGLSAREVDRLAGLTENHTRAIETKYDDRAQVSTVGKIAETLGVNASWLAYGEGDAPTKEAVQSAVDKARTALQPVSP